MAEQTSSLPPRGRTRPDVARRRIASFKKRFGEAHLYLAQHAAFPLAVTPELLYHLWANFQRDIRGERLNIPWIAVADLLLSGLFSEVSHELFEMDITLREVLLNDLKTHPNFGQQRIRDLSDFLSRYIEQQLESDDPHLRDVAKAHRWVVLAYTQPDVAARELDESLSKSVEQNDTAEQIWMASLIETFTEPLSGFVPLLTYARGIGYFAQGDIAQALAFLKRVDRDKKEHVAGLRLTLPVDIYEKESSQKDPEITEMIGAESEVIPSSSHAPIWHVPYQRNPYFTGREDVLEQLHHALHTDTGVALSHPQGISGLGGIGKTQIALEYAYRYHTDYQAVFWVRADSITALTSSMVELACVLKLPECAEQDREIIVQAVLRWFRLHTGWLLIYDDIDDISVIEPFLPKVGPGHLLFTTRAYVFPGIAQRLGIQQMEPEIGALLLLRRANILPLTATLEMANPDDESLACAISRELGGLPLALDQAGAYIKEAPCPLPKYLPLYQTRRNELLGMRGSFDQDYPASVATTWSLSFEKVRQANLAADELLNFCAFLAPDAIPEAMITKGAQYLPSHLQEVIVDPPRFDQSIATLLAYSLLHRNINETLDIHRLVQTILRDSMPAEAAHQWKQRLLLVVDSASPDVEDITQWDACEQWVPHALVCATWIEQENIIRVEAAHLLNTAGYYLNTRARYHEAEPLLVRALSIREQQLGTEHLDTTLSLDNLAALYKNQGKYAEAESLIVRALQIREKRLGPEHPYTAQSLNNLATLYLEEGRYTEAESLVVQALQIRERQLGVDHLDMAQSLNNLASIYRVRGKYTEAESLVVRALQIRERQLGANHPDTASSLNNLATLYQSQGKYAEAEPLYLRALAIYEQQLGVEHPDTANSLNNLAQLYVIQDKHEEAELLMKRALQIRERLLGPEHPDTANSLSNLAQLYALQGKHEEAELLMKRAPQISGQPLGVEHPDAGQSLTQEKREEAKPQHTISAETPSLGTSDHPSPVNLSQQTRFGDPFPEHWNVPRRHVPYFTGRDNLIQQIFQAFTTNRDEARIPEPQALVGLGGVGKTQTAAEYAYRYRANYKAVLWARADTKENLIADYRSLVNLLGLPKQEEPIEMMQRWFTTLNDWLLILDDADDLPIIYSFLPRSPRGHVLLTTRVRVISSVAQPLLLEPLKPEDGALYILRRARTIPRTGQLSDAPSSRVDAAIRISELMDGLPLALEQAGAYIEETGSSERRYLSIYEQHRAEVLKRQYGALPNYLASVAAAWAFSKSIVQQKEPAAFELLQLCAFLAPDAIPEEIFTKGADALGPVLQSIVADPISIDITTSILRRYLLLNREVKGEEEMFRFSMHRMMQEIIRDEMDEPTERLWAERAVRAVTQALPFVEWPIMQAHVQSCMKLIEKWDMTFSEAELLQLKIEEASEKEKI